MIKDIFVSLFSQFLDERGLSANLGTNLVMGKTSCREQWNLLPSSNGRHCVDGRDTSLDHLLWIDSLKWINWLTLDIKELLCEHRRSLIDWVTGSIEHSSEHFDTHWHSQDVTGELTCGSEVIDVGGSFEDLQTKVRKE